jgi:hypothetical protein
MERGTSSVPGGRVSNTEYVRYIALTPDTISKLSSIGGGIFALTRDSNSTTPATSIASTGRTTANSTIVTPRSENPGGVDGSLGISPASVGHDQTERTCSDRVEIHHPLLLDTPSFTVLALGRLTPMAGGESRHSPYHFGPSRDGGTVDAADSKSAGRKLVWVRVPLPVRNQ